MNLSTVDLFEDENNGPTTANYWDGVSANRLNELYTHGDIYAQPISGDDTTIELGA